MKTCQNCAHCKPKIGLLKRWDFCTRFRVPAHQRCADFQPKGMEGKHGA